MALGVLLLAVAPAPPAPATVNLHFEIVQVPRTTSADAGLTMATNVTGWGPAHACFRFVRAGHG